MSNVRWTLNKSAWADVKAKLVKKEFFCSSVGVATAKSLPLNWPDYCCRSSTRDITDGAKWEDETGKEDRVLKGESGEVNMLFSPDESF